MNETLEFMPAGGTAVAKATDVVSVITQFNALLVRRWTTDGRGLIED